MSIRTALIIVNDSVSKNHTGKFVLFVFFRFIWLSNPKQFLPNILITYFGVQALWKWLVAIYNQSSCLSTNPKRLRASGQFNLLWTDCYALGSSSSDLLSRCSLGIERMQLQTNCLETVTHQLGRHTRGTPCF